MRAFLLIVVTFTVGLLVNHRLLANESTRDIRTIDDSLQIPIDDGQGQSITMQGHLCRPAGATSPQLVIINHGSPPSSKDRPGMELIACKSEAVQWFVQRDYAVVVVLRLGYGATGGPWTEGYGGCLNADYFKAGLETARQINAIVDYATKLPNVKSSGVVVVGQSAGGWGTIAYNSLPHPQVSAFINMAGGRGGHYQNKPNNNCQSQNLVKAAGQYGKTSSTPMLWIYAGNDTFFAPTIADAMYKSFIDAGGRAQLIHPDKFGHDGHHLFLGDNGSEIWGPLVENYLNQVENAPK
jgi:dienelactone hydrolase